MFIQDDYGNVREVDHVVYYSNYRKNLVSIFKKSSDNELIDSFNGQVKNPGWCHAKMIYLDCLQQGGVDSE